MRGDFSRITFNPESDFTQLFLQQVRVILDADFNEQGAIVANAIRRLVVDLLGPHAGPDNGQGQVGFGVTRESATGKLLLNRGGYYVDGLLAFNHGLVIEDS